ncbi:hypothetical protein AVEN_178878-1 [Araneus ventricosus]|uniref:Uncharacterized protein n=1 Tax=Araneus ventricosus TaxID=182803 RepID=A0A4Y2I0X6_ARAVE|nr:hypothetical protein AVEN_178878-1 [Araneus ventricosus]
MSAFAPDTKRYLSEKNIFLIDQQTTRKMKGSAGKLNVLTSSEFCQSDSDDIFRPKVQFSTSGAPSDKPTTTNSTVDYTLLSRTCHRYGVSDGAVVAIDTAVLQTSTSEIIDKNKLLQKLKIARKLVAEEDTYKYLLYTSTDGKIEL